MASWDFISPPKAFAKFYLRPVYPTKFMVFRLHYWNMYLWIKKLKLFIFTHASHAELSSRLLSSTPLDGEKLIISPGRFFWKSKLSVSGGRKPWKSWKKWPKLNLKGTWSQVFINLTTFKRFAFLVTVLLYHNLDSSMLKC